MTALGSPPSLNPAQTGPAWWVRDILVAGIVGAIIATGTVIAQQRIDNERADRELRAANLAFVRERSSTDPLLPRPFAGLDLRGQNLAGLNLQNADFSSADLSGSNLTRTNLTGSLLEGADLSGANALSINLTDARMRRAVLTGASLMLADLSNADLATSNLRGVDLYAADLDSSDLGGADLVGADLRATDLGGADLEGADLSAVCWEQSSQVRPRSDLLYPNARWPQGFTPPPSAVSSCHFAS